MQMGLLADGGGGSGELSPNTIVLLLFILCAILFVFLVLLFLKKEREKKNEAESKEEFKNTLSEIEKNAEFSNLFKRITNIRGIALAALVVGFASCAVFLFAPIFQIKTEVFGETLVLKEFSLWDEVWHFYKDPFGMVTEPTVAQIISMLFSFFGISISALLLTAALITAFVLAWQFLAADKKKIINTLTHNVHDEDVKTRDNFTFHEHATHGSGLTICVNIFLVVYIFLMKYSFKDIDMGNLLFQEPPTYFPLANSVSWIWCILAVALFLGCVGMSFYVNKREKELEKDIKTFLVSISADNESPSENV